VGVFPDFESPDFESLGLDPPLAGPFWAEPESDPDEESRRFNLGRSSAELELGGDVCAGGLEVGEEPVVGADC